LQDAGIPEIYSNLLQRGSHHLAVYLRGDIDIASISDELRAQEQSVDATLPVFGAQALSGTVFASLAERRFSMEIVGLFALTALLLAALGVYGVISYMVNERTHEFGIRVALGAQRTNLLSMVLRQGLGLALAGTAVGLVAALIASQAMTGLLYGVRPTDPMTFFGVAVLLIVVALVACYIPARRAFRVDLMSALRHE
jgi:putative ABC transport system permease protein